MYRNIVIVLCVGIVWADNTFKTLDSIHQEQPCTSQGGICTIETDCPQGHLTEERGLCPEQRIIGVECCYGVSMKETRCHRRGGSCLSGPVTCNKHMQFKDATDCPKDTTCCILVE